MPSTAIESRMFGRLYSTDEMKEIFSDKAWVQRWIDAEAALAQAQGELGIIPEEKARLINKYNKAEALNIEHIGELFNSSITLVPFLTEYKSILPENAGEFVHWGATTQDIFDTGLVLMQRDAYRLILRDMKLCLSHCLDLAEKYKHTLMAGRTHAVHAIPITFGFKAAVWADELGRDIERLQDMAKRVFVGQFSGAVGTMASAPEHCFAVQKRMMQILGLEIPVISWYASRDSQAEFLSVLAICAGTLGRINHEIFSLQRTEILELEEPFFSGKVGSSTMPHKRNPAVVENVLAICRNLRSLQPGMLEAMIGENERDFGCYMSEWETIPHACHLMGAALEKSKHILKNLIVYPKHMERNLLAQKGLMMSESVMMHLAGKLGRITAHDLIHDFCMQAYEEEKPLKEILERSALISESFSATEIEDMLDPHNYLGAATDFVDHVCEHWRARC